MADGGSTSGVGGSGGGSSSSNVDASFDRMIKKLEEITIKKNQYTPEKQATETFRS
jgi:hypothetical protein